MLCWSVALISVKSEKKEEKIGEKRKDFSTTLPQVFSTQFNSSTTKKKADLLWSAFV